MGLDMYLEAQVYVGGQYDHRNVTGKIEIEINKMVLPISTHDVASIGINIGYWRKANAIHNWFMTQTQNDYSEDCTAGAPKELLIADLQNLAVLCEKVLAYPSTAKDVLPTTPGFFFGSTEYDEYYFSQLTNTLDIIDKANKLYDSTPREAYITFQYEGSW